MKKKALSVLTAVSVILSLCGCNKTEEKTSETTTTAVNQTEAEVPETTTEPSEAETTTAAPESTAEDTAAEPAPEKETENVLLMSFPDGTEFYLDDAAERTDSTATFDTAFLYPSSGSHFNSKANPELFDSENYFYKGEYAPVGEYTPVKAGDTFGSLTITSAKYSVYLYYPEGSTKPEAETLDNVVTLDGELTLSGIMYFYYDDDYTISAGDIHFIPDSSYEGLPMPLLSDGYGGYTSECTTMNFGEIVGGISCYSDAPEIRLGNLFADYADNAELNAFLDGGSAYCAKFAEITISDVQLEYSEQFGLRGLAKLVSVSKQK